MMNSLDFFDKINDCSSKADIDQVWQAFGQQLGYAESGTITTGFEDCKLRIKEIDTTYPDDTVNYFLEQKLFLYAESSNPLRKIDRLYGDHLTTFSQKGDGRGAGFKKFVNFVQNIEMPGQISIRSSSDSRSSTSFCLWSDEAQTKFQMQMRDNHNAIITTAGFASAKLSRLSPIITRNRCEATLLTARETDCLLWLARGDSYQQIADRLAIARKTVDFHVINTRKKLGSRTTVQAVTRAIMSGQIKP